MRIRLSVSDFPDHSPPRGHYILKLILSNFPVDLVDGPSDFHLFSIAGSDFLSADGPEKIFLGIEDSTPDFRCCDYAISFCSEIESPRNLVYSNLPNRWSFDEIGALETLHEHIDPEASWNRTAFATFVVSNAKAEPRVALADACAEVGDILYGGAFRNNIGGQLGGGGAIDEFLARARFNICGENARTPGYVTEKIYQGIRAGAIPIYWGDPSAFNELNPERAVFWAPGEAVAAVADRVRALNADRARFTDMLRQPVFRPETGISASLDKDRILGFLDDLFSGRLRSAPRPEYPDADWGRLKGTRRRVIAAPMAPPEWQAFLARRRELVETGEIDRQAPATQAERRTLRPAA